MKPIQLIMNAFGPYAHKQVIDFTEMGDHQLYLITGPTGSGKTTIFDGISYALYGQSSGETRNTEDFRSHFAGLSELTEVTLDFTLKGKYYRVRRIPRQERAKSRGEGTTIQPPIAELYVSSKQMDEANADQVITGIKEVDEQIELIVGVNADQFKQIMMIPQGEFRKLLTEGSTEREKVLSRLFDTGIYRMVQERLKELSLESGKLLKELKLENNTIIQLIKTTEDKEHPLNQAKEQKDMALVNVESVLEGIELLKKEDSGEIQILDQQLEAIRQEKDEQTKLKTKAEEMNQRIQQLDTYRETLKRHKENFEVINKIKDQIKVSEKAERVKVFYDKAKDQGQQIITQEDLYEEKGKALEQTLSVYQRLMNDLKRIESAKYLKAFEDKKATYRTLEAMVEKVFVYQGLEASIESEAYMVEEQKKEYLDAKDRLAQSIKDSNKIKQQITELSQVKDRISEIQIEISQKQSTQERMSEMFRHYQIAMEYKKSYEIAIKQEAEAIEELETMESDYKHLRRQYHLNQAAILATELEIGNPCPVCGSLEHPHKAIASGDIVSKLELDAEEEHLVVSRKLMNKALEKRQGLQNKLVGSQDRILELLKALESDQIIEQTKERSWAKAFLKDSYEHIMVSMKNAKKLMVAEEEVLNTLKTRQRQLNGEVHVGEELQKNLTALENMIQGLEVEVKDLEAVVKKVESAYQKSVGQLLGLGSDLPKEYLKKGLLDQEISQLKQDIEAIESEILAIRREFQNIKEEKDRIEASQETVRINLSQMKEQAIVLTQSFEDQLELQGFKDEIAFEDALLDSNQKEGLEKQVKDYENLNIQINQSIKEYEDLVGKASIQNLQVFEEQIQEIESKGDLVLKQRDDLVHRIEINEDVKRRIKGIMAKIKKANEDYERIGRISSVANGHNSLNITFERYVLAQLLNDITEAANLRLDKMTGGRYNLQRAEGNRDGRKQGGLDLAVSDSYTGKVRPVTSLSGGEMFKASLSMALGLSDVVQAYSGGVRLDAMFIDEGFGSLDQESLDQAINCLIDLQKTGRTIGIISHVAELKERIGTRLEITPSLVGSRAQFVIG